MTRLMLAAWNVIRVVKPVLYNTHPATPQPDRCHSVRPGSGEILIGKVVSEQPFQYSLLQLIMNDKYDYQKVDGHSRGPGHNARLASNQIYS